MAERPPFTRHGRENRPPNENRCRRSPERLSIDSDFGDACGMQRVGFSHVAVPPGRRTSWPHRESTEEGFVSGLEGDPDAWIDGVLDRLQAADAVYFPAGADIAHTFINNTGRDVRLLVGDERSRDLNRFHDPLHPRRSAESGRFHWKDAPTRLKGDHDGLPDALRADAADPD